MISTDVLDFQHKALLRLLKTLFALAGIVPGGAPVALLPKSVRNQILRMLSPLESAGRRLIYCLAQRTPSPEPKDQSAASDGDGLGKRKKKRRRGGKKRGTRAPVFWLFDKKLYCPHTADPHKRPPRGGPGPRITFFDGSDPPRDPVGDNTPRDPDDAVKLCRRLQALMLALSDLQGQALRMRRILDKRKDEPPMRGRTCPMRKGSAPGFRHGSRKEVHEILATCQQLAVLAFEDAAPVAPDSS